MRALQCRSSSLLPLRRRIPLLELRRQSPRGQLPRRPPHPPCGVLKLQEFLRRLRLRRRFSSLRHRLPLLHASLLRRRRPRLSLLYQLLRLRLQHHLAGEGMFRRAAARLFLDGDVGETAKELQIQIASK